MGDRSDDKPTGSEVEAKAGQTVLETFQDPGIPPHRPRLADTDPRAAKRAERQVAVLFGISVLGTILFFVAYFGVRLDQSVGTLRLQNMLLGLGTAFAMLGIGTGIVHWAKALMPDHEDSEERHPIRSEEDRKAAVEIVDAAMVKVHEFPLNGELYSEILSMYYLSKLQYSEMEMMDQLRLERSSYYRRKKEAVTVFGLAMWGGSIEDFRKVMNGPQQVSMFDQEEELCI